jgi:focal adhesion kinase 1
MAQFQQVQRIQINKNEHSSPSSSSETSRPNKYTLQLKISGTSELLSIKCSSLHIAQNIADLIDGYCKLISGSSKSFWIRKGN